MQFSDFHNEGQLTYSIPIQQILHCWLYGFLPAVPLVFDEALAGALVAGGALVGVLAGAAVAGGALVGGLAGALVGGFAGALVGGLAGALVVAGPVVFPFDCCLLNLSVSAFVIGPNTREGILQFCEWCIIV